VEIPIEYNEIRIMGAYGMVFLSIPLYRALKLY